MFPPFTAITATRISRRSPEWKLHGTIGMGKSAISRWTSGVDLHGNFLNSYNPGHPIYELWVIKDNDGKLEWVQLWATTGRFAYGDLPWARDKKWPRLT